MISRPFAPTSASFRIFRMTLGNRRSKQKKPYAPGLARNPRCVLKEGKAGLSIALAFARFGRDDRVSEARAEQYSSLRLARHPHLPHGECKIHREHCC